MIAVIDACEKITGTRPKTLEQVRAELLRVARDNDVDSFFENDDDLMMMFEVTAVFAPELNVSEIITDELVAFLTKKNVKTDGKVLTPLKNKKHKDMVKRVGEAIQISHPDLTFKVTEKGLTVLDDLNTVLHFNNLRRMQNRPTEVVGRLVLIRVRKKEDLDNVVMPEYLNGKNWKFMTMYLEGNESCAVGTFFTSMELLDLLSDRKIISHDSY